MIEKNTANAAASGSLVLRTSYKIRKNAAQKDDQNREQPRFYHMVDHIYSRFVIGKNFAIMLGIHLC